MSTQVNQYDSLGNLINCNPDPQVLVNTTGTAINPATEDGNLSSINLKVLTDTQLRASPVPISGAVVISSSALPTGGSTFAEQVTTNSLLTSVNTKTPALGQALAAASTPVVLPLTQNSVGPTSTGAGTLVTQVGGRNQNGNLTALATNNNGFLTVIATPTDGNKPTYSSAIASLSAGGVSTDILTINGSATKTIRVIKIILTGVQTTAAQRDVVILKRSAANTGGTSSVLTGVSQDSQNPAATAVVRAYTANATTLGLLVGNITTQKTFVSTAAGNSDEYIVEFGKGPSQALVLRGATEFCCLNLGGAASAGGIYNLSIVWTEE